MTAAMLTDCVPAQHGFRAAAETLATLTLLIARRTHSVHPPPPPRGHAELACLHSLDVTLGFTHSLTISPFIIRSLIHCIALPKAKKQSGSVAALPTRTTFFSPLPWAMQCNE